MLLFFCSLIAMSTLYVLDWHNRTFGYQKRQYAIESSTSGPILEQGSKIGHIVQVQNSVWTPPVQQNAPLLTSSCDDVHCHMYCCMERDQHSIPDGTAPFKVVFLSL